MSRPAATRWLLDTNVLSHAIRQPRSPLALYLQTLSTQWPNPLCTSVVVACELHFAAVKRQSASLGQKVATLLHFVPPLPLDDRVPSHYAQLRAHLERQGIPMGPNDLLIAAHALAAGCLRVTHNESRFRRVPGLHVANLLANLTQHVTAH